MFLRFYTKYLRNATSKCAETVIFYTFYKKVIFAVYNYGILKHNVYCILRPAYCIVPAAAGRC